VSNEFFDRLASSNRLPSPPGVAMRVLELCRSDEVSIVDVVDAIGADPALASKLLKYVNSPLAGSAREITSLKQAVTLVGLRTVKMIALSFSLVSREYGRGACDGFEYERFWSKSLASGVTASVLARETRAASPDEAFVTGLLTRIGSLAMACAVPDEYAHALKHANKTGELLEQVERERFGVSNLRVSAELIRRWQLPEALAEAVDRLDATDCAEPSDPPHLSHVLSLADLVGDVLTDAELRTPQRVERALAAAQRLFGLDAERWAELFDRIAEQWRSYGEVLQIATGQTPSFTQIQAEAVQQISELSLAVQLENQRMKDHNDELLRRASTDQLTGVGNRAAFDERLRLELERAERTERPVVLLLTDVDHFKWFNDTYGHQAGDAVLKAVAEALARTVRKIDYVARYGGEEFAVIAPECPGQAGAKLAERLRRAVEIVSVEWNGQPLGVTASIGGAVARWPEAPADPDSLINAADQRLYQAKEAGRNRCEFQQMPAPRASAA